MTSVKAFAKSTLFAFCTATMLTSGAQATTIDFEDIAHDTFFAGQSFVSNGFQLTHGGSFAVVYGNQEQGSTDFSGNGTHRWVSFNASSLTLRSLNGSQFSLSSFEGGESWVQPPHDWATQIQVVGTLAGGGTTTQVFNLDLIKNPTSGMQVFHFNNSFNNLTQVVFTGIGGNPEFSIDNIMMAAPVPEPSTYALMLAGLAGVVALARRRRA